MILAFRVLGQEVVAVEIRREDSGPAVITGGSGHNFERENQFGFGDD